jgi:cytidylate kinase
MSEMAERFADGQHSPLIVEVAGLAGSGKTTLLRALTGRDDTVRIISDLEIRTKEHIPILVHHAPFLLSLMRHRREGDGRFSWDEMKAMVYLKTWPMFLRKVTLERDRALLLNHGPIFKLATLHAFGPQRLQSERFDAWWHRVFTLWARTLDLVVWLNPPEATLIERINTRSQRHAVKGKPATEAAAFLARYQQGYEHVLARLSTYGGPAPLRFDTTEMSVEQIVEEVLQACSQKFVEARV